MRAFWAVLVSMLLLIFIWQIVIVSTGVQRFILPEPLKVAQSIWKSRALLAEHALITISEVILGLVLGVLLGMITAIQLASSAWASTYLRPVLVFTQAVPVFALAPILTLWFGYGIWSKIAMALLIIYFPVTSAFYDGLMRTPPGYIDLARTMGSGTWRTMVCMKIPAAVPSLMSGIRLAAVYAPIGAIIGEWVGASKGLGYLMLRANGEVKTDLMFAALVVLAAFTVVLHMAIDRAAARITDRYS
ncbi:MAG: ABC transporter permease [Pseudomonadota bacterium]